MKRLPAAKLLLLLAGTLVGLLAGELVLRVFKPQIFDVHAPGMYTLDREVGYVPTPGFAGCIRRPEFDACFTAGGAGLRGADPGPRRADTVRVLLLGDSLTWGFGVRDEETVAVRLEGLLAARHPELDLQVLNGGVPGYGTADQLAFLRSRGADLAPDVVILQFLPVNDFEENRTPAAGWATLEDGMLASTTSFREYLDWPLWLQVKTWLKSHSHFAHLVSDRLGYAAMRLGMAQQLGIEDGESFTTEDGERATDLLGGVAAAARDLGARTLFVFTTGQAEVIAEEPVALRSLAVIEAAASRAGVPWLDVTPGLRQRRDKLELFYPQDGHWTAVGHQAVAEILDRELSELGFIRAGSAENPP